MVLGKTKGIRMTLEILSPTERRERNRQEMIDAILQVSREIMRRDGAAGLNLNEVARTVGMKTPSLYVYFDGKMGIYDALFKMGMEMFGEQMKNITKNYTGLDALRAAIEGYMTFAQENPDLFQIMFERPVPGFVPSEESMAVSLNNLNESRQYMAQTFQEMGIETGMPVDQAEDLLIALMHGMASQHLANEPHLPIGQGRYGGLIDAAVELFQKAWFLY
jgi:AcrR family transcriptional regulator